MTEAKEVTGANTNWTQTFGYDIYGNRTSFSQNIGGIQTNGTPLVNPNTNRFTSTSFTYDKNGNITKDIDPVNNQARQTTLNSDNKQVEVKDANGNPIGKYYYDGEGKRVKKVTATETTIFVYDGDGDLIAEYSTQLNPQPEISYLTFDHLDSPRVITGATGNVISRRDFIPFGEEIYAGVGPRSTDLKYSASGTDNIRKRFTGYEKDDETELDFAENRMYQNKHGRFTTVDPLLDSAYLIDPQTFNRYIYTANNPVNFVDPDGLDYYRNNKTGKVHYYAGSDIRDGFTNITGQARKITGAGCDELGKCANVGDLLFFHSDSFEIISVFRQELEARVAGTEVHGGINPELLGGESFDVVADIISRNEGQLTLIPQEAPAIHDLLMGASPTLDVWEPVIHELSPVVYIFAMPVVAGPAVAATPLGLPRTVVNVNRVPRYTRSPENIAKMKKGKAPKGNDGHPVELHHQGQRPQGRLQEMTRTEHRGKGNYNKNHPHGNKRPSKIDRKLHNKEKKKYWIDKARSF